MSALKKTNLNSVADLRTSVDESLASSFAALGFTQSFTIVDTKIAIGLVSVAISGGLYLADKKFGFEATYNLTAVSVAVYFLLNVIHFYFSYSPAYKDVKYIGYDKTGRKVSVAGWTKSYDPLYYYKITVDGETPVEGKFEFMKVFDGLGYFKEDQLTKILSGELDKVSKKNL